MTSSPSSSPIPGNAGSPTRAFWLWKRLRQGARITARQPKKSSSAKIVAPICAALFVLVGASFVLLATTFYAPGYLAQARIDALYWPLVFILQAALNALWDMGVVEEDDGGEVRVVFEEEL